jgi:hypothetical protein
VGSTEVTGAARATAVTLPDDEWGYSGGRVRALRVEGQGEAVLTLRGPFDTERYSQVVARVRRVRGRPAVITTEWAAASQARPDPGRSAALVRDRTASRSWEILTLPLSDVPSWKQVGTVDRLALRIRLDGGPADAVDLDFVVLAP